MLLANDGALNGRQIIPGRWVKAMTTPEAAHLVVGVATPFNGYGYQTWLIDPSKRYLRSSRRARPGGVHRSRNQDRGRAHCSPCLAARPSRAPSSSPFLRRAQLFEAPIMTYVAKPRLHHPTLPKNKLGYTRRDYEGKVSTLCAGCGHDSISAALIQAFWELAIEPHRVAKLSGIGCSSKTPDYFLGNSHGQHRPRPHALGSHRRQPREPRPDLPWRLGDGDSASIGLGQFAHVMRRGVNMTYILENNGVYGLTKGQFSATADKGSKAKKGATNKDAPVDTVSLALLMGATFVARSFSGDKAQLIPLVKAAIAHPGAAFIDVISPCVASITTRAPPRATTTSASTTKPSTAWTSGLTRSHHR